MKVLFVVQGEGRGHLTQALTMEKMLRDAGHEVAGIFVGKSKCRNIPVFFYKKTKCPIMPFDSPNFVTDKNDCHIGHVRSTIFNILKMPKYMASIHKIYKTINDIQPDLVINFYEILCGMTYAILKPNVPEVCIGHQYAFLHPDFKFPAEHPYSQDWLRWFTKATCFGATRILALSFRPYDDDPTQNITVVPPLIRQEALDIPRHHGNYITGYILNAGFADSVIKWHANHPKVNLQFFWDKKDAETITKVDDTLSFHRIDDKAFLESLANCKAYASTGGFESICEALYMGKPTLMVPAHIEQECNVFDAQQQGAGVGAQSFDIDRLIEFSRTYEEDVEFRMWENSASTRIVAILENICNEAASLGRLTPTFA